MCSYDEGYQRLFRFIGRQVTTPLGSGKLEQVLGPSYVRVTLDRQLGAKQPKMTEFNCKEIGTPAEVRQRTEPPARTEPVPESRPFPRCPRCLSYALNRKNNVGFCECQTCGLEKITQEVAGRAE